MTDQTVLLEVFEGVATITLNRPEVYNALNLPISPHYWRHAFDG